MPSIHLPLFNVLDRNVLIIIIRLFKERWLEDRYYTITTCGLVLKSLIAVGVGKVKWCLGHRLRCNTKEN